MKTNTNIIRILSGLSFLIFFCPFLQTCSDASIIKNSHKAKPYTQEEDENNKSLQDRISKDEEANNIRLENGDFTVEEEAYLKIKRKEWTQNAYEFSWGMNKDLLTKFESSYLKEVDFYGCLIMPAVILISLIIFISSLYKKFRLVFKLVLVNLIMVFTFGFLLYIDTDELEMLRYGYCLFLLNTTAIAILSYKAKKQTHAI